MPTSSIPSIDPLQQFARTLAQRLDTNRDGQLSIDEFASFLSRLLGGGTLSASAATASTPSPRANLEQRFEGFNFEVEKDIAKSAKYAFAHFAKLSGEMPTTKQEAEDWFNRHIRPEMDKLGHRIDWVKGDKFQFSNWQGTWVVDYLRAAGASAGVPRALVWQAEPA